MTISLYTRPQIDALLRSNDAAVERAIVRLFELQTAGEQRVAHTTHKNDRGFCACDAKAGTRFARWILGMNDRNQRKFDPKKLADPRCFRLFSRYCKDVSGYSERPIDRARRIALKHSGQLVEIANAMAKQLAAETDRRLAKLEEKALAQRDALYKKEGLEQQVEALALSKVEQGVKAEAPTNEELAAEMAAESYGAAGGDQNELYEHHLARLNKEDTQKRYREQVGAPEESKGPQPGTWAYTARMMAAGDDSGFDWDRWKDEMKERDL
jgi:hypothetical protein